MFPIRKRSSFSSSRRFLRLASQSAAADAAFAYRNYQLYSWLRKNITICVLLSAGRIYWQRWAMCDGLMVPVVPKILRRLRLQVSYLRNDAGRRPCLHAKMERHRTMPTGLGLHHLIGDRPMSYRPHPPLNVANDLVQHCVKARLRMAGMDADTASEIASKYARQIQRPLQQFWESFPTHLHYDTVKQQLRPILRDGRVFVRIDRNPGRVVLMCRASGCRCKRRSF